MGPLLYLLVLDDNGIIVSLGISHIRMEKLWNMKVNKSEVSLVLQAGEYQMAKTTQIFIGNAWFGISMI